MDGVWCQPEQRGPANDTWSTVLSAAKHTIETMSRQPTAVVASTSKHHAEDEPTADGFITLVHSGDSESHRLKNNQQQSNPWLSRNRARLLAIDGNMQRLYARHGGTPWIPNAKVYPMTMLGLHDEIIDFYKWIKPSPIERKIRQQVFVRLRQLIHKLWPNAQVDYFGSFRTGLFLPTSDIDIVVIGKWEVAPLWTLAEELSKSDIADASAIKVLDKAAVPIVKFVDKDTELRLDVSFNMLQGVNAAILISDYMNRYPTLEYLVFVLKQFLLQRDLNEVFTGGVSSYSLILMAISFLQLHPSRKLIGVTKDQQNLGVLLAEFFELYGREFNYIRTALRIKDGGAYISKDVVLQQMANGYRPSMLCIEDPLQPSNDIGRGSHGALYVKSAFDHALFALLPAMFSDNAPAQMFTESGSVLARIIRITDEVIDYRDWLRGRLMQRAASAGGYNSATNSANQLASAPVTQNGTIRSYAHVVAANSSPHDPTLFTIQQHHHLPPSDGSVSDLSGGDEADETGNSSDDGANNKSAKRSYSSVAGSSFAEPASKAIATDDTAVVVAQDQIESTTTPDVVELTTDDDDSRASTTNDSHFDPIELPTSTRRNQRRKPTPSRGGGGGSAPVYSNDDSVDGSFVPNGSGYQPNRRHPLQQPQYPYRKFYVRSKTGRGRTSSGAFGIRETDRYRD